HDLAVERLLDLLVGDVDVLDGAEDVGELQAHELDFVALGTLEDLRLRLPGCGGRFDQGTRILANFSAASFVSKQKGAIYEAGQGIQRARRDRGSCSSGGGGCAVRLRTSVRTGQSHRGLAAAWPRADSACRTRRGDRRLGPRRRRVGQGARRRGRGGCPSGYSCRE